MMPPNLPRLLLPMLALCVLTACSTHSRVVRRDYDEPRSNPTRANRAAPISRAASAPIPAGAVHTVRAGETLYGISFGYGLRYQDVAAWNGISDPYTIEIGQRLRLKPPATPVVSAPPRPVPPAVAVATPKPTSSAAGSAAPKPRPPVVSPPNTGTAATTPGAVAPAPRPPAAAPVPPPATAPVAAPIVSTAPTPPSVPAVGAPKWRWPTRGQIIGRYVAGDQTQQGINIAGSAGQPVQASADGVVVYSGAGLVGYGELIIIKHSDEWLSAYAHNRKRLVAEGARVKAGDTIAEMGRTGAIRDMLHFEIRRNGKPVDPLAWLPGP